MIPQVYVRPVRTRELMGCFELIRRLPDGSRAVERVAGDDLASRLVGLPDEAGGRAMVQLRALRSSPVVIANGAGLPFGQAVVMGIVNVTPDSFSDGGAHASAGSAEVHAAFMREAGATIVDVGGESTRPGAAPVPVVEELRRVVPAIERIAAAGGVVSVDTRQAEVMTAAIAAGAAFVNDVSALRHDPASLRVIAEADVPVILMHAPGRGADLHAGAGYRDVVLDVFDFLEERRDAAIAGGIAADRIILDPGIGFGKSPAENLALLRELPLFAALGCPLLVGVSRKRMIAAIAGEAAPDLRLGGSLALALAALDGGAQILRVHDVAETVQAATVWRALRS